MTAAVPAAAFKREGELAKDSLNRSHLDNVEALE